MGFGLDHSRPGIVCSYRSWGAYSIFSLGLLCLQSPYSLTGLGVVLITLVISPAPGYDSSRPEMLTVNKKIATEPRFRI